MTSSYDPAEHVPAGGGEFDQIELTPEDMALLDEAGLAADGLPPEVLEDAVREQFEHALADDQFDWDAFPIDERSHGIITRTVRNNQKSSVLDLSGLGLELLTRSRESAVIIEPRWRSDSYDGT